MYEKKTTLPSLRNADWKTVLVEAEKSNKLWTHISRKNTPELNELNLCRSEISLRKNRGSS